MKSILRTFFRKKTTSDSAVGHPGPMPDQMAGGARLPDDLPEIEDDLQPQRPAKADVDRAVGEGSSDTGNLISVYDPGRSEWFSVTGDIITGRGGICEIRESVRDLIVASSAGEIYFSKSHRSNPMVLSEIQRIQDINGQARLKEGVDMSTLKEMYGRYEQRTNKSATFGTRNEQSRMQRELMSMVAQAAARNASDIHIIVNTDRAVVRLRVDGVMTDFLERQPQFASELLSAAFVMADESDTAYQRRSYQAARISSLTSELPPGVQSLRLQFNPLANDGRYLIMRILYSGEGKKVDLPGLGYSDEQVKQIAVMSARPVGINIVSGPTGSGKSTTLKAVLEQLIAKRKGELNTITIEDPPEYIIANTQQMPVTNVKTQDQREEAFTQAISAGMRSDPDIMMIGEIRDKASADLAVEGALSGHPIFASLHANTAMDILSRLRDMGIEDFKVFDPTVFSGLVGQRLVRQLCPHCRKPLDDAHDKGEIDPLVHERIQDMLAVTPEHIRETHPLYVHGDGCDHCVKGYNGRAVIAEIILPDDQFMEYMRENRKSDARRYWFQKLNGIDMLGSAWIRVLQGRVSPIDVENSVSLLTPHDAHEQALHYWLGKLPEFTQ